MKSVLDQLALQAISLILKTTHITNRSKGRLDRAPLNSTLGRRRWDTVKATHIAILTVALLVFSETARADFDLKTYKKLKQNTALAEKLNDYTTGVGRGIFWANIMIEARGGSKLFCMPPKLAPDEGLIQSLLDQEIRAPSSGKDYPPDTSIEFILLRAFESRFPCE